MPTLRIILLCTLAAILFGILHDQITARICVQYFTVAHPPIFNTDSPTLLGLGWGIIATWWVGAGLGLLLAAAARLGSSPKLAARDLARPITTLLLITSACAAIAGTIGYVLPASGSIRLVGWFAQNIPAPMHDRFLADAFAHTTSYCVGALGGIVVAIRTLARRRSARKPSPLPPPTPTST